MYVCINMYVCNVSMCVYEYMREGEKRKQAPPTHTSKGASGSSLHQKAGLYH